LKKNTILLWVLLITSHLNAQSYDMKICEKDGNQIIVATETITKMTFALDQTHALLVSQKDGLQIKSIITGIDKITFNELTPIEATEQQLKMNIKTFVLHQSYPNPFNRSTIIKYELPTPGWVHIQIFNVKGQLIRNLESRYWHSGVHSIVWNGENDNLQPVTTGPYFYKVKFNDSFQMKKLLIVE
jgi:hypothetical protein